MKKFFTFLFIVALIGFTSCNKNKEVDISYQLDLTINPADVIGSFVEYYDGDFDMYEGDVLRIHLFIYDAQGNLAVQFKESVSDYSEIVSFSKMLPIGDYTIIASSDIYTPSYGFEYYSFSNEGRLDELEILETGYIGYNDKILGLVASKLTVDKPIKAEIRIQAATSLLEFHWSKVHYWSDVYEYGFYINDMNKIVSYDGNSFDFSPSSSGYYYTLMTINPQNFSSDNVYGYTAILPIDNVSYFARAEFGEEYKDFGNGTKTFKAGKQYNITINAAQLSVNISSITKNSSGEKTFERDIQKINVEQFIKVNPQLMQKELIK